MFFSKSVHDRTPPCIKSAVVLLSAVLVMQACRSDRSPRIDVSMPDFATTDASELYFNNVRSAYYDLETNDAAGLKVYRYRRGTVDSARFSLNPSIVVNWRADMAYILLEPSGPVKPGDAFTLECIVSGDARPAEVAWHQGNAQEQYVFAARIYNSLLQDEPRFVLVYNDRRVNVLDRDGELKDLKMVFRDYFRLVEAL